MGEWEENEVEASQKIHEIRSSSILLPSPSFPPLQNIITEQIHQTKCECKADNDQL